MKITSLNNPKVVFWAKLKLKKYRDIENLFIVETRHLVDEAYKKGVVKEIICLNEENSYDVPCYEVSKEVMQRVSSLVSAPDVIAVCNYILPDDISGNVLMLDRLQDPGNLGTIIRSAVAFNFNTIIVSSDTVDMYNDKVLRASEGMIFNVNIIKSDLKSIIPILKSKGYEIVGTDVKRGVNVTNYHNHKCAFIIGNEGSGMSVELKEMCDALVYIKMSGKCESLNASVASSIIMYEVSK